MNSIIKKYNQQLYSKGGQRSAHDESEVGLERIAKDLYRLSKRRHKELLNVVAPEKKLVVMIMGNHSAGKSSFINWYVEEEVQRTKVAIETTELSLIMQGRESGEFSGFNAM
mmetsp:Transcript_32486/g.24005  ORF Transcript_32486/g.24005 Transcript_32486/m.24005 type:complete len:112 (-) Transcript_32486:819-1154(-)